MNESRFDKLDNKIEKVREDVSELKVDLKAHIVESKINMDVIRDHVAGDKKIINAIEPLMSELPDLVNIIKEYQFNKLKKQKKLSFLNITKSKIAILVGVITIIGSIYGIFF